MNQTLQQAGIRREDCHVTNAALCRGETDKDNDKAAECCAPRLLREVAEVDAPLLTLGKAALTSVLGVKSVTLARGFIWRAPDLAKKLAVASGLVRRDKKKGVVNVKHDMKLEDLTLRQALVGRVVFPSVHPAFVLRSDAWRPILELDVRRVARYLNGSFVDESYIERTDGLEFGPGQWYGGDNVVHLEELGSRLGHEIGVDIETDGLQPLTASIVCVGLSDGERSLVIDPWQPEVHAPLLTKLLAGRVGVLHNGYGFDHIALERDGVGNVGSAEDTLLAHHSFASHLPQKLDQVVSEYCDFSPWKLAHGMRSGGQEKGNLPHKMEPAERDMYCAIDCVGTILSWKRMQADLEKEKAVYEGDKELAALCKRMQVLGIGVDQEARIDLSHQLEVKGEALKDKMRQLLGWSEFAPSKHAHVSKALYSILKAPILGQTKGGKPATGEAVLEALAGQQTPAGEFARDLMTWRLVKKVQSTYVDPIPTLHDDRAHYNWKSFGTVSGRLASRIMSCPRYGSLPEQQPRGLYVSTGKVSGARLVLQVHDAACFEVAGELVYFDLSQAEARFAAYLSGDDALIEAVQSDIHTANAQLIFGGMPGAKERLERANEKSLILDSHGKPMKWKSVARELGGCKEERDFAKPCGFCVWYIGGPDKAFTALNNAGFKVSLKACNAFHQRFHDKYWRYYAYVDRNLALVRKQGYMRTAKTGRFRWLGYFPDLPDVANYPIQAGIADEMNTRLVLMEREAMAMTKPEDVEDLICRTWAQPVVLPKGPLVAVERSFVLPADIKRGKKWSDFG